VRQERFVERLYTKKVDEIVDAQVTDSKCRFKWWFSFTLAAYIVVIILALVAVWWVPGFM
jgi:hypothetical protein